MPAPNCPIVTPIIIPVIAPSMVPITIPLKTAVCFLSSIQVLHPFDLTVF